MILKATANDKVRCTAFVLRTVDYATNKSTERRVKRAPESQRPNYEFKNKSALSRTRGRALGSTGWVQGLQFAPV